MTIVERKFCDVSIFLKSYCLSNMPDKIGAFVQNVTL